MFLDTQTPMPDIETVSPACSISSKVRNKKYSKKKTSNPFLENDGVVNPFINYDHQRTVKKHEKSESTASSASTLFDDNNPFKVITNNNNPKNKPLPPKRISSLVKTEDKTEDKLQVKEGKTLCFLSLS